jgi:hypothetical protein
MLLSTSTVARGVGELSRLGEVAELAEGGSKLSSKQSRAITNETMIIAIAVDATHQVIRVDFLIAFSTSRGLPGETLDPEGPNRLRQQCIERVGFDSSWHSKLPRRKRRGFGGPTPVVQIITIASVRCLQRLGTRCNV